jgi:gamma-glutamyl hydrolase
MAINKMLKLCVLVTLAVAAFATIEHHEVQKEDRPVIGILTLPTKYEDFPISANYTTYIAASYVKWAEGGGARVIPLKVNDSKENLTELISKVNGIIFTGGTAPFFSNRETDVLSDYADIGCFIYDQVI